MKEWFLIRWEERRRVVSSYLWFLYEFDERVPELGQLRECGASHGNIAYIVRNVILAILTQFSVSKPIRIVKMIQEG